MQTDPVITVTTTATLSSAQAWAFAEFLKRVGLSDFAALAMHLVAAYASNTGARGRFDA